LSLNNKEIKMVGRGAVRFLEPQDYTRCNHFGNELVSWKSISQSGYGLFNPLGFACLRVVMQKEEADGSLVDLYDRPLFIDDLGAVVLCQNGEKIGFVQSFRIVGERISITGSGYVAALDAERRWVELLASLGEEKWELPRGIAPVDNTDPIQAALAVAHQEALEEGGFELAEAKVIGQINVDPTFFAHPLYVVSAQLKAQQRPHAEESEFIGPASFFSPDQIRELVNAGSIDDAMSISALALAGIHF
jgi:8-oxo-dGTP pyrophosphatase MutT (NUDIX family)